MMKALVFAAALCVCIGNPNENETDAIKSLNGVENLQIIGDLVTIASKNSTESLSEDCDGFDKYLQTHVIRIKVPLLRNKYFNIELSDLICADKAEGRKKRTRLREILIPLLLAFKYKLTVVLPIFMAFVLGVALKGFWAGMTGLFISKLVALKILLQSQSKPGEDHREDEDSESDDHHSYEIPHQNTQEEEHEDDWQPVVIHLHNSQPAKLSRRSKGSFKMKRRYNSKRWEP